MKGIYKLLAVGIFFGFFFNQLMDENPLINQIIKTPNSYTPKKASSRGLGEPSRLYKEEIMKPKTNKSLDSTERQRPLRGVQEPVKGIDRLSPPSIYTTSTVYEPIYHNPPDITTTTTPESPVSLCVRASGFDPDSFIYYYNNVCGETHASTALTYSRRVGLKLINVKNTVLKDKEKHLMECFFGEYELNIEKFGQCPLLICSKSGENELIQPAMPVSKQFRDFALSCKNS